jgi:DNA-binding HxlR family transcriptional regulator
LDRVGDKWSLLVLSTLTNGEMRFMDLKRTISDISQRVLTQTLRNLEKDGYVSRKIYPEIPPKVEYALMPMGISFLTEMKPVFEWAMKWNTAINESRANYPEDAGD